MNYFKLLPLFLAAALMLLSCKKEENTSGCGDVTSISYGGQTYNTITIGTQCWMKQNLNIGNKINGAGNQSNNSTVEKYCYDDNTTNCSSNGGLYQWDEAMQYSQAAGSRGICPDGWHIPSDAEWTLLTNFLGSTPGSKLKAGGSSGFEALLSGYRSSTGTYANSGQFGYYWSSTKSDASQAWLISVSSFETGISRSYNYKVIGFSVRCIKN